jgi:hypothetical protein
MTKLSNKRHFPLGDKVYQLQKYLQKLIHNFRREHKYNLGENIMQKSWELSDVIYQANNCPVKARSKYIQQASTIFDQLENRIKMAHDLKLISHKQMGEIAKQSEEIGKMLTGWLRWAKKQTSS